MLGSSIRVSYTSHTKAFDTSTRHSYDDCRTMFMYMGPGGPSPTGSPSPH